MCQVQTLYITLLLQFLMFYYSCTPACQEIPDTMAAWFLIHQTQPYIHTYTTVPMYLNAALSFLNRNEQLLSVMVRPDEHDSQGENRSSFVTTSPWTQYLKRPPALQNVSWLYYLTWYDVQKTQIVDEEFEYTNDYYAHMFETEKEIDRFLQNCSESDEQYSSYFSHRLHCEHPSYHNHKAYRRKRRNIVYVQGPALRAISRLKDDNDEDNNDYEYYFQMVLIMLCPYTLSLIHI